MPEWPKGADCKSAGLCLRWFESTSLHAGVAQLVELQPSRLVVEGSSPFARSTASHGLAALRAACTASRCKGLSARADSLLAASPLVGSAGRRVLRPLRFASRAPTARARVGFPTAAKPL